MPSTMYRPTTTMHRAQATQLRFQLMRQPRCPDCGGPLVHGEGCATCPICGYSHCG